MISLFRLLLLVLVFVGVFQVLVHAQELIWCIDEQSIVRARERGCETGEWQASRPTAESRDLSLGVFIGVVGGIAGAILGAFVTHRLQRAREREIQGIEIFWRYRKEAFDNPALRKVMEEGKFSTEKDIKMAVDFYEEVGLHASKKFIDMDLLDEIIGDYIIDAYDSPGVKEWIGGVREESGDATYYEHFMTIGRQLSANAEKRKKKENQ